eukprot:5498920-Alexandrium_andersonii.AAC.1
MSQTASSRASRQPVRPSPPPSRLACARSRRRRRSAVRRWARACTRTTSSWTSRPARSRRSGRPSS